MSSAKKYILLIFPWGRIRLCRVHKTELLTSAVNYISRYKQSLRVFSSRRKVNYCS